MAEAFRSRFLERLVWALLRTAHRERTKTFPNDPYASSSLACHASPDAYLSFPIAVSPFPIANLLRGVVDNEKLSYASLMLALRGDAIAAVSGSRY